MQDGRGSSVKKGKGNSLQVVAKDFMKRSLGLGKLSAKPKAKKAKKAYKGQTGPQKIMKAARGHNQAARRAVREAGK